jgi:hypothetical protein
MPRRRPPGCGLNPRNVIATDVRRLCIGCPAWIGGQYLACAPCWVSLPSSLRARLKGGPGSPDPDALAEAVSRLSRTGGAG